MQEARRGRRRRLTARAIARRMRWPWGPSERTTALKWPTERAERTGIPLRRAQDPNLCHRWAKLSPGGCGCRKRAHGKPREDAGMCCCGARGRVYAWRREAREAKAWWGSGEDGDCGLRRTSWYDR